MAAELWAVQGDKTDHGEGAFKEPAKKTITIGGKPVIVKDDEAFPDNDGHTDTQADSTSGTVYAYGKKIHRNNDTRHCGAKTVVSNQSTVKSG